MSPLFKHSHSHTHEFFPTDPQGPDIDAQSCSLVYQVLCLKRRYLLFIWGGWLYLQKKNPRNKQKYSTRQILTQILRTETRLWQVWQSLISLDKNCLCLNNDKIDYLYARGKIICMAKFNSVLLILYRGPSVGLLIDVWSSLIHPQGSLPLIINIQQ